MRRGLLAAPAALFVGAVLANAQERLPAPPAPGHLESIPYISAPSVLDDGRYGGHGYSVDSDFGPRTWISIDHLLWWTKDGPTPELVTTGPLTAPVPGAVNHPGTGVLFGGSDLDYHTFSGLRLRGGVWLSHDDSLGVEASYFTLERRSVAFAFASDAGGVPLIARPALNAVTGTETVYLDSLAGLIAGGVGVTSTSRLQGYEINLVTGACRSASARFDLLVGFRALDLNEDLQIEDHVRPLTSGFLTFRGAAIAPPSSLTDFDRFHTSDKFYGGQLGGRLGWRAGPLETTLTGKLALGVTQELVTIDGVSTLLTPGAPPLTVPGGILAQTTNIGRHFHDHFALVPEVGLDVGYALSPHWQVHGGITGFYWNRVARAGDQIDRRVNPFLVPTDPSFGAGTGPARPALNFHQSDFWAYGLNFGLEFRY
jgi:hypothetical protein